MSVFVSSLEYFANKIPLNPSHFIASDTEIIIFRDGKLVMTSSLTKCNDGIVELYGGGYACKACAKVFASILVNDVDELIKHCLLCRKLQYVVTLLVLLFCLTFLSTRMST